MRRLIIFLMLLAPIIACANKRLACEAEKVRILSGLCDQRFGACLAYVDEVYCQKLNPRFRVACQEQIRTACLEDLKEFRELMREKLSEYKCS